MSSFAALKDRRETRQTQSRFYAYASVSSGKSTTSPSESQSTSTGLEDATVNGHVDGSSSSSSSKSASLVSVKDTLASLTLDRTTEKDGARSRAAQPAVADSDSDSSPASVPAPAAAGREKPRSHSQPCKHKRAGKPDGQKGQSSLGPEAGERPGPRAGGTVDESAEKIFGLDGPDSTVGVKRIAGRGRGLIAKKRFEVGAKVITTQPAVSVLSLGKLQQICSGCFMSLRDLEMVLASKSGRGSGSAEGSSAEQGRGKGKKRRLNRCSGCKALHYCSRECQLSDWPAHQPECTAFKRMKGMYLSAYPARRGDDEDISWAGPDAMRALARICWGRKKLGEQWWEKMRAMESHVPNLSESEIMQLGHQIQHLCHYLGASRPLAPGEDPNILHPVDVQEFGFETTSELLHLCSAFLVNSFTLSSPSLSPIGVSTSPLVALANHSCSPNAVVVFPNGGNVMEVIAIAPIQPGEEILTSYIDVSTPFADRQSELISRYRFVCSCSLCEIDKKAERADPKWCILHPGCGKKGRAKMPDLGAAQKQSMKCEACDEVFDLDVGKVGKMVREAKDILAQEDNGSLDEAAARQTFSTLIPSLLLHLPPSSHPLLPLLRLNALLLTPPRDPAQQNLVLSHLSLAYRGSEQVYPPHHPALGLLLAEWGKLLTLPIHEHQYLADDDYQSPSVRKQVAQRLQEEVQRLDLAVVILRKAVGELDKSFGIGGGVVGAEMEELLRGCQGELGVMKSQMAAMNRAK